MKSNDTSKARSHTDLLDPGLLSRWQNELFYFHLFEMSQYLPVFNLGLVYAQSHSQKSKRELLKGKTTALATERRKNLDLLQPTTSHGQNHCFKPNIIAAGWLRELLSSDKGLMGRGFPRLLSLPVSTSCL